MQTLGTRSLYECSEKPFSQKGLGSKKTQICFFQAFCIAFFSAIGDLRNIPVTLEAARAKSLQRIRFLSSRLEGTGGPRPHLAMI